MHVGVIHGRVVIGIPRGVVGVAVRLICVIDQDLEPDFPALLRLDTQCRPWQQGLQHVSALCDGACRRQFGRSRSTLPVIVEMPAQFRLFGCHPGADRPLAHVFGADFRSQKHLNAVVPPQPAFIFVFHPCVIRDKDQHQQSLPVPPEPQPRLMIRSCLGFPYRWQKQIDAKPAIAPVVGLSIDDHLLHQGDVVDGR